MINNKRLNTESWYNTTRKLSIKVPLMVTGLLAFLYIDCTNAKYRFFFFFFAQYFFCNCPKIILTFVVHYPGIKPNCISLMSTCCLINFSVILTAIFTIWWVSFSPLSFSLSKKNCLFFLTVWNCAKFPFYYNNSYYNLIY